MVAVFFDFEKAYDTTWKHGILSDLHDVNLRESLPIFISNFLKKRHFKVRLGSALSDLYDQETGVSQGCILSVTFFSLIVIKIVYTLNKYINCSLYVDDFLICYRSRRMHNIERQLHMSLNRIQNCTDENGFKFSKSTTVRTQLCQQRKHHPEPLLDLNNEPNQIVKETKFIGIIFDSKLTFLLHIKYLKVKCLKALNLPH